MPFIRPLPQWDAAGTEPPLSLKENGWIAGQKPAADYFNWLQNSCYLALLELQEKAGEVKTINGNGPNEFGDLSFAIDTSGLVTQEEFDELGTQTSMFNRDLLELTFQLKLDNLVSDDSMKTVYVDTAEDLLVTKGIFNNGLGKVYI